MCGGQSAEDKVRRTMCEDKMFETKCPNLLPVLRAFEVARRFGGFCLNLLPAAVPVLPIRFPVFSGQRLAGPLERVFGGCELRLDGGFVTPLEIGFEQAEQVFGMVGAKLD